MAGWRHPQSAASWRTLLKCVTFDRSLRYSVRPQITSETPRLHAESQVPETHEGREGREPCVMTVDGLCALAGPSVWTPGRCC